jgi:hypothetical protein
LKSIANWADKAKIVWTDLPSNFDDQTGIPFSAELQTRSRKAIYCCIDALAMNLNSGTPWSELALADLRNSMQLGKSVEEIADFLCRDVDQVRAKIATIDPQYPGVNRR